MTVSSTSNKISYPGNGSTTAWSFNFPGVDEDDIYVILTDADGVEVLLASNQYSVALNAAIAPNPTGVGGFVNYPLSGSPLALGNTITIYRNAPYIQPYSLVNQGTLYQQVIEQALDYQTLIIQQMNDRTTRIVQGPVSDPDGLNYELPSVESRAGQVLGFDSSGNVTTLASLAAGTVSSAMQPVVNAATLALGRTAFGLGTMAVENIGAGLQDDGAGSARVNLIPSTDSIGQTVTSAFHLTERHASAAITYTNPASSTLFNGFGYFIYANGGAVTVAINVADSFQGMSSGASLTIQQGAWAYISTNGAGTWYSRGTTWGGFDTVQNISVVASVATNALTIALKDAAGNNPSVASPVLARFRDTAAGLPSGPIFLAATTALSLTIPNTATMGTTANQMSRLWFLEFNNGGSPILGVINCSNTTNIFPLDEGSLQTTTLLDTSSDSVGVIYTTVALTSKAFRILGYVELTQVTPGVWAASPSKVQLFGPGIKKPGDVVQTQIQSNTSATVSGTFTASSAANPVEVSAPSNLGNSSLGADNTLTLKRDATTIATFVGSIAGNGSRYFMCSGPVFDFPGAAQVTYSDVVSVSAGAAVLTTHKLKVTEYMG